MRVTDRWLAPIVRLIPKWVSPNTISVGRTLVVIPIILLAKDHPYLAGFGLFLPAILLDMLDGPLARIRGQESKLGAFLDATGDKIFIHGTLWLAVYPFIPYLWALAVVISGFDFLLLLVRPIKHRLGISSKANVYGKIKIWCQSFAVGFLLLRAPGLLLPAILIALVSLVFAFNSLLLHLRDIQMKFRPR